MLLLRYLFIFLVFFYGTLFSRDYIIIQSTTSTVNSGLLEILSDNFYKETGIEVRSVSVGTGTAISNAKEVTEIFY